MRDAWWSAILVSLVLGSCPATLAHAGDGGPYRATCVVDRGGAALLGLEPESGRPWTSKQALVETSYPRVIAEEQSIGPDRIVELSGRSHDIVVDALRSRRVRVEPLPLSKGQDEVAELARTGPPVNRIDLAILGDGYTASERDAFLADARRLLSDLFEAPAFRPYRPLFNAYAVFRASVESGIGRNGPRNTAYRLHREGNTLRGILCGDSQAARESCRAAPGCEYPVIIANDPFYGGLGGEFAITTSSRTSGAKVLRHELGHNLGRVGEEYDGGESFGANFARDLRSLSWKHWTTGTVRVEPVRTRLVAWPWHDLAGGGYTALFDSDGGAYTHLRVSLSGFAVPGEIAVTLDGRPLAIPCPGHPDRATADWFVDRGIPAGRHALRFDETVHDGDNRVASLTVHEYRADFVFDEEAIGAYPVFTRSGNVQGYRPSWETCLMRNMESVRLCAVCAENVWLKLLARVSLIDGIDVRAVDGRVEARLRVPALGQFRPVPAAGETLRIAWYRDGQRLSRFDDQLEISVPAPVTVTGCKVEVALVTPDVRRDPDGRLRSERIFSLPGREAAPEPRKTP